MLSAVPRCVGWLALQPPTTTEPCSGARWLPQCAVVSYAPVSEGIVRFTRWTTVENDLLRTLWVTVVLNEDSSNPIVPAGRGVVEGGAQELFKLNSRRSYTCEGQEGPCFSSSH